MPFLGSRGAAPDPRGAAAQPMPGVTEWLCPRNGVYVAELHYTADPAKRDPQWKKAAQQGMPPRGWQREMEIAFDLAAGEPVLPEYVPAEMRRPFPVNPGARLLRGWDFGQVCPVTLFAQLDIHGRLGFVGELVLEHSNLTTQIEATKAMTLELVGPGANCFDAGDPEALHEMEPGSIRRCLLSHGSILHTFGGRGDTSALAPSIAAVLAPGGRVILSGLLRSQERRVRAAYLAQGLRLEHRLYRDAWVTLVMARGPVRY